MKIDPKNPNLVQRNVNKKITHAIPLELTQPLLDFAARKNVKTSTIINEFLYKLLKVKPERSKRGRKLGSKNKPKSPWVRQMRVALQDMTEDEMREFIESRIHEEYDNTRQTSETILDRDGKIDSASTDDESDTVSVTPDTEGRE